MRLVATAALVTFALTAVVLLDDRGGGSESVRPRSSTTPLPPPGAPTTQRLVALRAAVRAEPLRVDGRVSLAATELQGVRETGDPAGYVRAERQLERALQLRPGDPGALTERAQLRLARHDFRGGLRDALAAHRVAPTVLRPYGPLVDANVELGRYDAAERTLQEMLDRKPELAGFTRLSYVRELHGDLRGAVAALRAANSASGTPEGQAFVQSLVGGLELQRGNVGVARRAYRRAQVAFPTSGPAQVGLARVDAARGALDAAIARLRRLVAPVPRPAAGDLLPLAEMELADGRRAAALRHLEQARAHQRSETRAGVDVRIERALLEADHGDPREAVALARAGMRGGPSVRADHALGWALTQAGRPDEGLRWARRSLRLGWRDPLPRLHAGLAAVAAGEPRQARRWLQDAVRGRAWLGPWQAAKAQRALARLGA